MYGDDAIPQFPPELKPTRMTYTVIHFSALDKFIDKKFPGQRYELAYQNECSNDTLYHFTVLAKASYQYEAFKKDKAEGCRLGYLLDGMCLDGMIPPGEYLIDVSW